MRRVDKSRTKSVHELLKQDSQDVTDNIMERHRLSLEAKIQRDAQQKPLPGPFPRYSCERSPRLQAESLAPFMVSTKIIRPCKICFILF